MLFLRKFTRFSTRMILLLFVCIVLPLCGLSIYVRHSMEHFIQNKLSERIIQNISRSERNICDELQNLAAFSNIFLFDEELKRRISEPELSAYENTLYFNQFLETVFTGQSFGDMESIKIILFDNYHRMYSNWSLNYRNYQSLLDEEWVQKSVSQNGHVVWSMFSPAYIVEDQGREKTYISLARSILKYGTAGERIGTLIISIDQERFGDILMEYAYAGDVAYVCIDDGIVLIENDREHRIDEGSLASVYRDCQNSRSGSLLKKAGGQEYLVSYYTIPKPWVFNDQQMKIFHFTSYQEVSNQVEMITSQMNLVIVFFLVLMVLILTMAIRRLVKPIEVLTNQMSEFSIDREIVGIDTDRCDEIGRLNRSFLRMSDNIKQLFVKLKEEIEIKEQYRFESLRAQLNPHFLFNTLTTIRFMALIRGAENIVDSIDALASMLKYSMNREKGLVTLKDELDNIRHYVYIQNCRYGEHCELIVMVPEELYVLRTMKFILQPIVENAVIHGYHANKENITIQVFGQVQDEKLVIEIEDNGVGISKDAIRQFEDNRQSRQKESKVTGIGLHNVDECIRITFGDEYGVILNEGEAQGTKVTFMLPVIREEFGDREESDDC